MLKGAAEGIKKEAVEIKKCADARGRVDAPECVELISYAFEMLSFPSICIWGCSHVCAPV